MLQYGKINLTNLAEVLKTNDDKIESIEIRKNNRIQIIGFENIKDKIKLI